MVDRGIEPCEPHTHVLTVSNEKLGRPGRSGDVIGRCCISPPTSYCTVHALNCMASGQRYATISQTVSDYITRSTRLSQFFCVKHLKWEALDTRLGPCNINNLFGQPYHCVDSGACMPQFYRCPLKLQLWPTGLELEGSENGCFQELLPVQLHN